MSLVSPNSNMNREQLWKTFLERWPLEALTKMTLEEYNRVGDQDSFTYWLESRTETLGSIWGGSAFKFGIFNRRDRKTVENGRGRSYTDDYAWYSKYGSTPEDAFQRVKATILDIVEGARKGDLDQVERADLGTAIKWKLAFLYQNLNSLCIVPVYSAEHLRAFLKETSFSESMPALQRRVMKQLSNQPIFDFGVRVWKEAELALGNQPLTTDAALEYLKERFSLLREPVQYMAGFVTDQGYPLALDRNTKKVSLFLRLGEWARPGVAVTRHYGSGDSRHSNLDAHAPALAVGHEACKVEVDTLSALKALCDAYDRDPTTGEEPIIEEKGKATTVTMPASTPLNQILYGPPGTGKTHRTIEKALAILDPEFFAQNRENRQILKARFDKEIELGHVRFVTFHQSFSYEDFVEGLRADTDENGALRYQVEPGVFRKLCTDALATPEQAAELGISRSPRIWKISIDGTGASKTRDYCLAHGEARIGWGNAGDLAQLNASATGNAYFESLGSNDQNTLLTFAREIQPGDILICIRSQTEAQAIGVVEEGYRYDPNPPADVRKDYPNVIKVKWLFKNLSLSLFDLNGNRGFTQKTVYELNRITWEELTDLLNKHGLLVNMSSAAHKAKPQQQRYVLIIDEINRGNVSRIFGELITLIEPSKRAGTPEALEVILPYSKKPFRVPSNVYLIGTMNTADRSLAGLDIALRRRFVFEEMLPQSELLSEVNVEGMSIEALLTTMNQRIEMLLDRDHCLGHAYLLPLKNDPSLEQLALIFRQQIVPLLQEYFFEDWERIRRVLNDHRKPVAEHQFIMPALSDSYTLLGDDYGISAGNQRWRLNHGAFEQIESYRGILGP